MARTKKAATIVAEVKNNVEVINPTTTSPAVAEQSVTTKAAPKAKKSAKAETPKVVETKTAPKAKKATKKSVKKSVKAEAPKAVETVAAPIVEAPKAKRGRPVGSKNKKQSAKSESKVKVAAPVVEAPKAEVVSVKATAATKQPTDKLTTLVDKECKKNVARTKDGKKLAHHHACLKIKEYAEKYGIPYGYIAYVAIGTSAQKPSAFMAGYTSFDEAKMTRVIKLAGIMQKRFGYKKNTGALFHMLSGYYTKFKGNMAFFKRAIENVPTEGFKLSKYKTAKELSDLIFSVSE